MEMLTAVDACLKDRGRLLIEAGTGVGKTLAYLVPAIHRAVESRELVVVCTNTISLQEQILDKDIPLLNAVIPEEFSAVLVKGRSNYISLRRLRLASERGDRLFEDDDERHSLDQIEAWAYETRDGTLATLPQIPHHTSVWSHVQSDADNCMGRRCPTYDKCFFQAARRRMENANLLVCNHALFFSDLALRRSGKGFLPPYRHVILDEAHAVEDVACEHFGARLGEGAVTHLLRQLWNPSRARGFLAVLQTSEGSSRTVEDAIKATEAARVAAAGYFTDLRHRLAAGGNGIIDRSNPVPDTLSMPLRELVDLLKLTRAATKNEADTFELNAFIQRTLAAAATAEQFGAPVAKGTVAWIEQGKGGLPQAARRRGQAPISLCSAAVEAGPVLREALYAQDISVVLTSATLACGDDFSLIRRSLGVEDGKAVRLGSPFDHARLVRLMIDSTMPEPTDPQYDDQLARRILEQVAATDGGAFVLFTNYQSLNTAATALASHFAGLGNPLLVQGSDGSRSTLLNRFKDDERSVLFGTSTFWQGIDVRGRALRNVIITRLPFDVPDRPLNRARQDLIKSRGGNSFSEDTLPRAVIRFKQGFGRLIRSSTDTGRVVVLDRRILTKPYGRAFLKALPDGVEPEVIGSDFNDSP